MNRIKAIFFDMGNTLLHFHYGDSDDEKDEKGLLYLTQYLNKFNSNITLEEVKTGFLDKWFEAIEDRGIKNIEYPIEDFLNEFLSKYNLEFTMEQCIEAINLFYKEYREQVRFENNLYNILKEIKEKGYKIGVVSNTCYYDEVMKECFKKAGIYDLVDQYTFSYSLRVGKPDIRIFKAAIERMKVSPEEIIMVGDNLKSDIKPASDLGMKTVWLNTNNKTNDVGIAPDFEIGSISELVNLI